MLLLELLLFGATQDNTPDPSVVNIYPELPPVIVTLEIFPKLLELYTVRLVLLILLLVASKVMFPVMSPCLTLKYLNDTVPLSL